MFVPTKSCTYQQHTARVARLMEEGFHDGQRWKPEAHARYAELELYDTPPGPQSAIKDRDVVAYELVAQYLRDLAGHTARAVNSRVIGTDSNQEANDKAAKEIEAALYEYSRLVARGITGQ